MKELLIYLKTTETCNLNCSHCFTSGSKGAKIYFDPIKVTDWLHRLHKELPLSPNVHCEFHGGEPFLADLADMQYVYDHAKDIWPSMSWGVTTNLVFKLDQAKIDFIKGPLGGHLGTSWDPDIRFANPRQYDLWRKNIQLLQAEGVTIKLFVSVTTGTLEIEPIELLEWVRELGVQSLALERLTHNGSANNNPHIFPSNLDQDAWFLKMHQQIKQYNTREWFQNEFFEHIYSKFESGFTTAGTFCRDCEEKLFTLNADGTIAGCPNSAPEQAFGHINNDVHELLYGEKRLEVIACERSRDPRCYECPVFSYCGGDCHQLAWQGDVCGAPKSVMRDLAGINTHNNKIFMIKEI